MANIKDKKLNEIIPGLYLGNYGAAKSIDILQSNYITHILVFNIFLLKIEKIVGEELEAKFPDKFFYFKVDAQDQPTYDLGEYFD